jgi:hypothetical protein
MYAKTTVGSENFSTYNETTHLHIYKNQRSVFYIISQKEKMDWGKFLIDGFICQGITRFIEVSYDEFGIQRIVKDVRR